MYKKILLLFYFSFAIINGQTVVEKIRFGNEMVIFDLSGHRIPDKLITYDKNNRLIFIEFADSRTSNNIEPELINNGSYVESIKNMNFGGNVDFFIKLQPNVSFHEETLYNPTRYLLRFQKENKKDFSILIDPGHGGLDPGAVGYMNLHEKDIVFNISNKLKRYLQTDYSVDMTRTEDEFLSLGRRAEMSNRQDVDLFVSIHANAHTDSTAEGTEAFYYSRTPDEYAKSIAAYENKVDEEFGIETDYTEFIVNDIIYQINKEKSIEFASDIVDEISSRTGLVRRKILGGNFAVLRGSRSPAVLIEVGFISNRNDAAKLKDPEYQDKIAKAIYEAIKDNSN